MQNTQVAEKRRYHDGSTLEVHSIFHTMQGEGPYAGVPAVFVRLAGCNLQCPKCDTIYTAGRHEMTVAAILEDIHTRKWKATRLVVITGGEPFRQNLLPFITSLLANGFQVQLETNGTLYQDLPYDQVAVVCSPKTGSINRQLAPHLTALKYVVNADCLEEDGYPLRALDNPVERLARPPKEFKGAIYLQPFDSGDLVQNQVHTVATMAACFNTGHTLCLQLHKILNLE